MVSPRPQAVPTRVWLIAISVASLLATTAGSAADQADLVLYNGKVLTVDKDFSIKSAVAVKGGSILAVGGDDLAKRYTAAHALDLRGRTLIPGFMDTHLHIIEMSH